MVVILKMSKCVFNYLLLAAQVSIIRTGRPIGIIFSESKSGFYILKKKKQKKILSLLYIARRLCLLPITHYIWFERIVPIKNWAEL